MTHPNDEILQRYLCGEAEADAVDEVLRAAGEPDAEDLAWIASVDLRPAVLREITPWYRTPQGLLLLGALLASAGFLAEQVYASALSLADPFLIAVRLPRLLYAAATFLAEGGLLPAVWPLVAGATVLLLYMQRRASHA
jgi:hypothetical protein